MSQKSGYFSSFIVHAALVAAGVGFASATVPVLNDTPGDDASGGGGIVVVEPGDSGSGGAAGVPAADPKPALPASSPLKLTTIDSREFIQSLDAARRNAERRRAEALAAVNRGNHTAPPAKKESLESFLLSNGQSGRGNRTDPVAPGAGKGPGGQVGPGAGGATGPVGQGKVGVGKSNGSADAIFAAGVKQAFAEVYLPLFREKGGEMASSRDEGVVRVSVSPAGLVSFSGWVLDPAEPVLKGLVTEAIGRMPPVKPHPAGETVQLKFAVGARLLD